MNKERGLAISFDDQSHSFAHGFEAGMLWVRMQERQDVHGCTITACIHQANCALVHRMGLYLGWSVWFSPTEEEGWIDVSLERVVGSGTSEKGKVAPAKPRPPLRVIHGGAGDGAS